jgi:hypothetical protein
MYVYKILKALKFKKSRWCWKKYRQSFPVSRFIYLCPGFHYDFSPRFH